MSYIKNFFIVGMCVFIYQINHVYPQTNDLTYETLSELNDDLNFHDEVMENTYQIYGKNEEPNHFIRATCFIIYRHDENDNSTEHLLITANHVLNDIKNDSAYLVVRKRLPEGNWLIDSIPFQIRYEGQDLWFSPTDTNLDLAILKVNLEQCKLKGLSMNSLADVNIFEEFNINPNDDTLNIFGYPKDEIFHDCLPIKDIGPLRSHIKLKNNMSKFIYCGIEVQEGNSGGPAYIMQKYRTYEKFNEFITVQNFQYIVGLVTHKTIITYDNSSIDGVPIIIKVVWGKIIPSYTLIDFINNLK